MAIKLKSTADYSANGYKVLVYGHSGVGKTTLIKTMPNPVILSVEGGLLSLSDTKTPYIEIGNIEELREAYKWIVESEEAKQFQSVALDSISEIAEVVLAYEKKTNKDGRAAYGEMQTTMGELIRSFRDLPGRNVYFSAQCEKITDETGRLLYGPAMPGTKLSQKLPYFFDFVFALRAEKDDEGIVQRALMTQTDGLWQAKGRMTEGRMLEPYEIPDLSAAFDKLGGRL